MLGGQLGPIPTSQTRWYLKDLESAQRQADGGSMSQAARLWRACQSDGVFSGVLSTRTEGLVRLPKKFKGKRSIVKTLEAGNDSVSSVFDEMFPPAEIAALAADGIGLGVGVGELKAVKGRDFPIFIRLDPEFLTYRWNEGRWYYRSVAGDLPVDPGDGRWVLHLPGGRLSPWNNGKWRAVGKAWIHKEHAALYDTNWQSKLANPARVAVAPQGAAEPQKQGWFQAVMAWGINSVFGVTPGYDVKLLESNGRGSDSFDRTITRSEREMIVSVAGQEVTTDGGAGFQNSDIHGSIRKDLIKGTADALAYTINTQGLPPWVVTKFGEKALNDSAIVEWDVEPPEDKKRSAETLRVIGDAIKAINESVSAAGKEVDVVRLAEQFDVPLKAAPKTEPGELVPTATTEEKESPEQVAA